MDPKPPPFTRRGTKEEPVEVSADEILEAIAEGRDIDVHHAIIEGDLRIVKVADRLEKQRTSKYGSQKKPIIEGNIRIFYGTIYGETEFFDTIFSGKVDFSFTAFAGLARFSGAIFSEDVDFSLALFNEDAAFSRVTFNRKSKFNAAHLVYPHFGGATFNEDANFVNASFSGNPKFEHVRFGSDVLFEGVSADNPGNFADVHFRENTVFVGLWNHFLRWLPRVIVFAVSIGKLKVSGLPKWPVTNFSGFNTNIVIDASSNPYLKRYIDDEQWIESWKNRGWWRKVLFVLWELTSHCGRSFGLWLFWALAIATAFARIYDSLGNKHIAFNVEKFLEQGVNPDFWSYLYYSIVTFTTLGFGDIVPLSNLGRLVVGIEVFLGYLMLGGLISIFANKFARRS